MLLGEYGVLQGGQAIVCAVDKRITVTLTPRVDEKINIDSTLHGQYATELAAVNIEKPFQFVLGAIRQYQPWLRKGFDLHIATEFSDKIGFGSSAAVTVATMSAIMNWLNIRSAPLDIVRQGRNIIRQIQGVGSGADISASVLGGVVAYRNQPVSAEKYTSLHPLTVLYAGYKTKTADAIQHVQQQFASHPHLLRSLHTSINQCAMEGAQLIRKEDWQSFGKIMNVQQGMMEALGVSTPLLQNMVTTLREGNAMFGAKISGSGLGDCVVGLGDTTVSSPLPQGVEQIPVAMTLQGVKCEKI